MPIKIIQNKVFNTGQVEVEGIADMCSQFLFLSFIFST